MDIALKTLREKMAFVNDRYTHYLPTAYNNSLTILEKMNKIIEHLNLNDDVTLNTIDLLDDVLDTITEEGINSNVERKVAEMLEDGTLGLDIEGIKSEFELETTKLKDDFTLETGKLIAEIDRVEAEYPLQLTEIENNLTAHKEDYATLEDMVAGVINNDITNVLNNELVATDIANKLNAKEVEYAPRLTSVEVQLEESISQLKGNHSVWEEFEQRGVNVKWFGAISDANYYDEINKKYYKDIAMTIPSTDNKVAFQNAVNHLNSIGGGVLFVPKGTYLFKSGIKWLSKVSMVGAGIENTRFVVEGVVFSLFHNLDGYSNGSSVLDVDVWINDCRFEHFSADLIGLTHTEVSVGGKAFFILYMKRARFSNLYLKNTIGTALGCDFLIDTVIDKVIVERAGRNGIGYGGNSGIGIGSCASENEPVIVSNCHIYNCGNYGIFVETQNNPSGVKSQHAQIINNYCDGNNLGIGNKGSGGVLISGNSVLNSLKSGIHLTQDAGNDIVTNNKVVSNGGDGIFVGSGYKGDLIILGNSIERNGARGIFIDSTTITPSKNFTINSNIIGDNNLSGIDLLGGQKNVMIATNTIKNNGKNSGTSYGNNGINLQSAKGIGQERLSIVGNLIFDDQEVKTQVNGIKTQVGSNLTDVLISNNNVVGYAYNVGFNIASGTRTNVVIKNNTGHITELNGSDTIPDGATSATITFPLSMAKTPTTIILSVGANEPVWYSSATRLSFKVNRVGNVGALNFSWKAEI